MGEVSLRLRWNSVVDDVKGSGDYLRDIQLSTLNDLSGELSGGFGGRIVAELLG